MLSLHGGRQKRRVFVMVYWFVLAYRVNVEHEAQHTLFMKTVNNVIRCPLGCPRWVNNSGEGGEQRRHHWDALICATSLRNAVKCPLCLQIYSHRIGVLVWETDRCHMNCRIRRCSTFSQPQSQGKFLSPEWAVVISCRMAIFSIGSRSFCLTDSHVGTAERTVILCINSLSLWNRVTHKHTLDLVHPNDHQLRGWRILTKLVFSCWLRMT